MRIVTNSHFSNGVIPPTREPRSSWWPSGPVLAKCAASRSQSITKARGRSKWVTRNMKRRVCSCRLEYTSETRSSTINVWGEFCKERSCPAVQLSFLHEHNRTPHSHQHRAEESNTWSPRFHTAQRQVWILEVGDPSLYRPLPRESLWLARRIHGLMWTSSWNALGYAHPL